MAAFIRGEFVFSCTFAVVLICSGLFSGCSSNSDSPAAGQGAPGAVCKAASDCQSGSCFGGACQSGSGPSGGSCTTGADCQSGSCMAGTCQGGGVPVGGSCTDASSCQSNKCVSGTCQGGSVPSGATCATGADCQSGRCSSGVCQSGGTSPSGSCTTGADCQSGSCVSGVCQPGGSFCVQGTQGCPCGAASACGMGLTCMNGTCCDSATQNCSPPNNVGTGAGGATGNPNDSGSVCKPGVVGAVLTDCGYPYQSKNPLTNIGFSESEVLAAIVPSGGSPLATIQLFYNDEHAMTLGVRQVVVNGKTTDYPVSPLTSDPGTVNTPQTGTNQLTGDQAGLDISGRPMWPALFVTDVTGDANSVSGDWQWGGTAWNPNYVSGTWKAAVRTVDASGASITPDSDPAKNNQNYGNGHTAPSGSIQRPQGFGAEVRWDMRLAPGHNYRFQVMVHDGDQTREGGDTGEACVNFCAGTSCPTGIPTCNSNSDCTNGNACSGGCCVSPPGPPGPPTAPDGGTCPPNWQIYVQTEGQSICTPPPQGGSCPAGYVVFIESNHQYCLPVQIH